MKQREEGTDALPPSYEDIYISKEVCTQHTQKHEPHFILPGILPDGK